MKTAVIILNYNNASATADCLRTFAERNSSPVRIVVVDNASTPTQQQALRQAIASYCPEATLVVSGENLGYARGNNLGLDVAYGDPEVDRVLILNNDILWTDDILPELIKRQDAMEKCAILSPILYKADGLTLDVNCARRNPTVGQLIKRNLLHYYWRARHLTDRQAQPDLYLLGSDTPSGGAIEVELPSGSCMLISKALMHEIGSFDPNTFLYYEENILYRKISAKGLRNYVFPDLSCIHLGAATTSALPSSLAVMRHSMRSARYYVRAYSGAAWPMRLAHRLSCAFLLASFRLQKSFSKK